MSNKFDTCSWFIYKIFHCLNGFKKTKNKLLFWNFTLCNSTIWQCFLWCLVPLLVMFNAEYLSQKYLYRSWNELLAFKWLLIFIKLHNYSFDVLVMDSDVFFDTAIYVLWESSYFVSVLIFTFFCLMTCYHTATCN